MKELKMPSFGADMAEGTLVQWQVKPGDQIQRGDIIAVIETSKGAIDFDVYDEGEVGELLIGEGDTVTVGTPIVRIYEAGEAGEAGEEAIEEKAKEETRIKAENKAEEKGLEEAVSTIRPAEPTLLEPAPLAVEVSTPAAVPPKVPVPLPGGTFVLASPAARALASQRGIALSQLGQGRGPGGALLLADIEQAKAQPSTAELSTAATATETRKPSPTDKPSPAHFDRQQMREAISATVARSKREIPHYYLATELALDGCQAFLQQYNAQQEPENRLLLPALLYTALAQCLKRFQQFNGHFLADGFAPVDQVNLATAVNLRGGGLVMPVIRQAESLDPTQMMATIKDQVARARSGQLRQSELGDGSCAVTSLGDRGVESIYGVILPPQVAIIGLGRLLPKPVVADDAVTIGQRMTATLAADHRVSDGHDGARFLTTFNQLLQNPEALWTAMP